MPTLRRPLCVLPALFGSLFLLLACASALAATGAVSVLKQIQDRHQEIHDLVAPAVVAVQTRGSQPGAGYYGTGVVISPTGLILTSSTVVPGNSKRVQVFFTDGRVLEAKVAAFNEEVETCVLQVILPPQQQGRTLPFVELRDSSRVNIGELAYTAGNPFHTISRDGQVAWSVGTVSGQYELVSADEQSRYRGLVLETDAAVNPGSDGGPLLDGSGRLLGIISLSFCDSRWLGTAIPVHLIKPVLGSVLSDILLREETVLCNVENSGPALAARAVNDVIQALAPAAQGAVVKLHVRRSGARGADELRSSPLRRLRQRPSAPVSGVLVDPEGYVLTSAFNVEGEVGVEVELASGTRIPAEVIGRHLALDIALLRFRPPEAESLPVLPLSTRPVLRSGDFVAVLGAGPVPTRTQGIVSAVSRFDGAAAQTDALVNYGNAGGAVLDLHGRLIGIASHLKAQADWSQQNSGVGFFTPANRILACLDDLKAGRELKAPARAFLGIAPLENSPEGQGVQLAEVISGSAADNAGLKAGDLITALDGTPTEAWLNLVRVLKSRQPGDRIKITFQRGESSSEIETVLTARQESQ